MKLNDLATIEQSAEPIFSLVPRTFQEAMNQAKMFADSDLVPKDYRGKPANILVAWQMGGEVGMKMAASLKNIAVINGRPTIYGDGLWGLIKSSPLCEWTDETFDDAAMIATCTIKRRGSPAVIRTFSKADAEKAGLWNKDGPWKQYSKRMLQMRARGFACRDAIPEAVQGLHIREEVEDMKDMGDAEIVRPEIQMPEPREIPLPDGRRVAAHAEPKSETPSKSEAKPEVVDMATGEVTHSETPAVPFTPGQVAIIREKMKQFNVDEREIQKRFGVPLERIPFSRDNFLDVQNFVTGAQ